MLISPRSFPVADAATSHVDVVESLRTWTDEGEQPEHRQYIFQYHTMLCQQFASGYCPRLPARSNQTLGKGHKASKAGQGQCFCYHFESQRRRPLVDPTSGVLRYWDVQCERVAEGQDCPAGDSCPFAHTREEISYHAAKYKTKLCNDRDCRGQDVCCFAHGDYELRHRALDRYSYWSVFGGAGLQGVRALGNLDPSMGALIHGRAAMGALYHPKVYKHRFCASFPAVVTCRRGESCAFAHSRDEIRTPLLSEDEEAQKQHALTNDFFMFKFKTLWCPIGVQHDWQTCVYAHNYQDARRHPGIGYGPRPCPYWKRKETTLEYAQRCPLGCRCPFSHGAKEQLYHPSYFKTVTCQDWPNANCPRRKLCAFWHKRGEMRSQQRAQTATDEDFDYKMPIVEVKLGQELQTDFLSPPFKLLSALQADGQMLQDAPELQAITGQGSGQHHGHGGMVPPPPMIPAGGWGNQRCGPSGGFVIRSPSGSPATSATTAADSDDAASADSTSGSDQSPQIAAREDFGMVGMGLGGGYLPMGGLGGAFGQQPLMCLFPVNGMHPMHSGFHNAEGGGRGQQGGGHQHHNNHHSSSYMGGSAPGPGGDDGQMQMPWLMTGFPMGGGYPGGVYGAAAGGEWSDWNGMAHGWGGSQSLVHWGGERPSMEHQYAIDSAAEATGQSTTVAELADLAAQGMAGEDEGMGWLAEEGMPTHNGFIHFKCEGEEDEEVAECGGTPKGNRPRAASH